MFVVGCIVLGMALMLGLSELYLRLNPKHVQRYEEHLRRTRNIGGKDW